MKKGIVILFLVVIGIGVAKAQGRLFSYVKTDNGGKLFVAAETMVALLMGYPDGERNVHKMMETRWWGKDSRLFMEELIVWGMSK